MAAQGARGPLDYSAWDADKPAYFAAIRAGLDREYAAMEDLVRKALAGGAG